MKGAGSVYVSSPVPHTHLARTPGKALQFGATDKCLETHDNWYNDEGRGGSSCVLNPPCSPGPVLIAFKVLSHEMGTTVPSAFLTSTSQMEKSKSGEVMVLVLRWALD